ncbi:TrmH family RNA methyltransferase [Ostreibacterium oceani]|uniref:TrmH family RNA methyltransferase n=1 Tax=Ostreibacterium oceani TaxID=2654998 RepID=A0A6N7EUD2_9GAMM|nr:TrmH family RNA methyltransferase [Ostreibacterium oceani]MPV85235.1 TrmH family RNA methyltransferase [Ostreibacterium oceani]
MAKHKIERRCHAQSQWTFRKQRNANRFASPGKHAVILVLDGLNASHNIGKIFRSAEAFSAHSIHVINTPYFDVAPAKGAFKHVPASFFHTFDQSYQQLATDGYEIYALHPPETPPEISPETPLPHLQTSYLQTNYLHTKQLPKKTAFVMGHEQNGLSFNPTQYPKITPLSIQQFGQTESLNVAVAASLCLYEYTNQHAAPLN